MIFVIVLLALAVWAVIATVVELRRDGYRQRPTDWRRVAEHESLDDAGVGHGYR
ncbi:hypothetical protein [Microbacterium sp. NPDC089695]|uniref:hypothetical protein n=1 Tax=Microbacterium sp. NPDC089695 TaxID=3364198 RepID=UPI0037F43DD8